MIELSRAQISFAEGLIEEEVGSLWEPWMRQVDELLADGELLQIVYAALARRSPKSRTRGRPGTPAKVVLARIGAVGTRADRIEQRQRPENAPDGFCRYFHC